MRDIRGKQISLILQEPMTSLNPVLSIGCQIGEVIRRHERLSRRAARARAHRAARPGRAFPTRSAASTTIRTISRGGMRQRVMIAMAVACGPSC